VVIDDQKAGFEATQHLIDSGCKKIAHIRGPLNPQNSIDRYLGYKKALEKNNIPFDSKLVYTCNKVTYDEGIQFTKQLIEEHPDVDGIFAITDLVAVGAIVYCNDKNIKIPNDLKIIGFSNWFMSQIIKPNLSTVEQPSYEMGTAAFNLLLEEMQSRKDGLPFTPKSIELNTQIISRETT
jgi:LacI family transcriptional regulator